MGALDAVAMARVEAHVAGCDVCSERLAHEARLELAFEHVVQHAPVARVVPLRKRPRAAAAGYALVGTLAVAAAALVWVGRSALVDGSLGHDAVPAAGGPSWASQDAAPTARADAMSERDALDGG
jgi:hypothetical protein